MNQRGILPGKIAALVAWAMMLAWLALPAPLVAQTLHTYVNNSSGTINSATTCTNPLVRNFSVGTNYLVGDVQIGVHATHTWRGDLRITLQSPSGTRVQLVKGDTGSTSGDHFNVRLSDGGTQVVNTDSPTGNHSNTMPPPFQHTFIPNSPLSAFIGQSSAGTWRLEICDLYPTADNGEFRYAALYLTSMPTNWADLSLSKSVSNASPTYGSTITYTLTANNAAASPNTATGVAVTDLLPAGVAYVGHSGWGSYDPVTGIWNIGSISAGQNRALTITATVTATSGATVVNAAEVTASSHPDIDSTPGNGATGEDDYASASFTVSGTRVAGTPPVLSCPKNTLLFDWDGRAWTPGSTSNTYAITGLGNIAFDLTNPGAWLNLLGGINPRLTNVVTGGLSPVQLSLAQTVDLANRNDVVTTEITLPMAVDGLQFRIFDVDYGANQFADRVRVTGTYNGSPVTPVLTNSIANYVIGNQAFGDVLSADNSGNGNVTVTFQSAVDTIVIEYGNHALAPVNPGQQAITIHDITFCEPHADIVVAKTATVLSNPVQGTTNPLAIPGAEISYCILVTNSGSAPAAGVVATDPMPANVTYIAGSMQSGSACASATTPEDDNATGADDNDAVGASFAGNQVQIVAATLAPGQSIAVRFRATVN